MAAKRVEVLVAEMGEMKAYLIAMNEKMEERFASIEELLKKLVEGQSRGATPEERWENSNLGGKREEQEEEILGNNERGPLRDPIREEEFERGQEPRETFQPPVGSPPKRELEHAIILKEGVSPISVKHHRYAQIQKDKSSSNFHLFTLRTRWVFGRVVLLDQSLMDRLLGRMKPTTYEASEGRASRGPYGAHQSLKFEGKKFGGKISGAIKGSFNVLGKRGFQN